MSTRRILICIGASVVGAVVGFIGEWYGWYDWLPDITINRDSLDIPAPPVWLVDAARTFLTHIAEPMYWLLVVVSLLAYLILLWQKRPRESYAAKALRWFTMSKAVLWLAFALGRLFGEWSIIMFAGAAIYVGMTGIWWLIALYLTYVRPSRAQRVAVVSDVLPPYAGTERRSGFERRAGWRKISE